MSRTNSTILSKGARLVVENFEMAIFEFTSTGSDIHSAGKKKKKKEKLQFMRYLGLQLSPHLLVSEGHHHNS